MIAIRGEHHVGCGETVQWCERNKGRSYIPESLLKQWGILVDPNFSG
jgi:hypothetical protein